MGRSAEILGIDLQSRSRPLAVTEGGEEGKQRRGHQQVEALPMAVIGMRKSLLMGFSLRVCGGWESGARTAVGASTGCASISFLGQRNVDAEMRQETKGGLAYKHDVK